MVQKLIELGWPSEDDPRSDTDQLSEVSHEVGAELSVPFERLCIKALLCGAENEEGDCQSIQISQLELADLVTACGLNPNTGREAHTGIDRV